MASSRTTLLTAGVLAAATLISCVTPNATSTEASGRQLVTFTQEFNMQAQAVDLLQPIAGRVVYVSEPVAFTVRPLDDAPRPLTYRVSGLPTSAVVNAQTGAFSWRPAIGDTGTLTATFVATSGQVSDTVTTTFTVIMPTVTSDQVLRILRPAAGETYTYGDTLMVAFAVIGCSQEAAVSVRNVRRSACDYTTTATTWLRMGADSVDARGIECRYFRSFPDQGINIGFYKLALRDTSTGCRVNFGGDTAVADSVRIRLYDPYVEHRSGVCETPVAFNVLASGVSSGYFRVTPSINTAVINPVRRR